MTAAVVLLAWSAATAVTAVGARWLPVTPRKLLIGGLIGCAAGQLSVYGLHPDSSILRLLPGLLLAGAANGILNAALGHQAVASVPADRSAMGSGANNTARYPAPPRGSPSVRSSSPMRARRPVRRDYWRLEQRRAGHGRVFSSGCLGRMDDPRAFRFRSGH